MSDFDNFILLTKAEKHVVIFKQILEACILILLI